jgi:hypothetical protein
MAGKRVRGPKFTFNVREDGIDGFAVLAQRRTDDAARRLEVEIDVTKQRIQYQPPSLMIRKVK